jgi:hypothetical protein
MIMTNSEQEGQDMENCGSEDDADDDDNITRSPAQVPKPSQRLAMVLTHFRA